MHKPITLLAFAAVANVCQAGTDNYPQTYRCTTQPCANTPTGEDQEIVQLRAGKKIEGDLRNSPDDARRWSTLILFSESTDKDDLTMPIIKSSNFLMILNPKKGILHFSSPQFSQYFKIDSGEPHDQNEICPNYHLRVLDGTAEYALIKKTCPKREYAPNRFYRATTYYLYDMRTATMRDIWEGSRSFDTTSPFPSAKPEITLKETKDGYQFDWIGMSVSDNPPTLSRIHRAYKRERGKDGQMYLVCYDTTQPRHPVKENGACESGILERIRP